MTGLDIHYKLGDGHPLLGRRMPDPDLTSHRGEQGLADALSTLFRGANRDVATTIAARRPCRLR